MPSRSPKSIKFFPHQLKRMDDLIGRYPVTANWIARVAVDYYLDACERENRLIVPERAANGVEASDPASEADRRRELSQRLDEELAPSSPARKARSSRHSKRAG